MVLVSVFRGIQAERPRTNELMAELIERLGGRVESVRITAVQEGGTIFATIRVATNRAIEAIDCRPSDTLSLAIQTNAQIFIADQVLDQHGRAEVSISFPKKVIKPWERKVAA